jgi:hypothetical protein
MRGGSTLFRTKPMRLRSREAGSAKSSELEARPNGGQKRKEGVHGGLWATAKHGKNAANRRTGNCISEKEFTEDSKLLVVIGTRVKCRSELWWRDWVWHSLRQKSEKMRRGH